MQKKSDAQCSEKHGEGCALKRIERELQIFEAAERNRLGLDPAPRQWQDANPRRFTRDQRASTTLLFGGMTAMHDGFIEAAVRSLGQRAKALEPTDGEALQLGKEFCNRAQCNPTYYTVGNLLKHLARLRDVDGMSTERIVAENVFVTVGNCGPCRFGTYVTEYRKALRDAGFEGFRVIDLMRCLEHRRSPEQGGLRLDRHFAVAVLKSLMAADVLKGLGYRIRPYEVRAGATDAALEECGTIVRAAIDQKRSLVKALHRCRRVLAGIEVDRLQPKPKVAIIGEFWAMTTEGDGNYRLQRFLEDEGAECDVQPVFAYILYDIWARLFDTRQRMMLRRRDHERHRHEAASPALTLFMLHVVRSVLVLYFTRYARAVGLKRYDLPDMEHLARIAREWYPNELYGGEGHLEVAKVINTATENSANMVISVKPFGCMPSSGVSDGVQAAVTARYPDVNFCTIETSGDGAVSVYSRIQMALFKARSKAQMEFEKALAAAGLDGQELAVRHGGKLRRALHYPAHRAASTAANAVYEHCRFKQKN